MPLDDERLPEHPVIEQRGNRALTFTELWLYEGECPSSEIAEPFIAAMRDVIAKAIAHGQLRPQAQDLMYAPDILPSLALGRRVFGLTEPIDVETIVDTILLPVLTNA